MIIYLFDVSLYIFWEGDMKKTAFLIVAIVFLISTISTVSWAIHKGAGSLWCHGCHTMHNSENGSGNVWGDISPNPKLLKGGVGSDFCLQCHDADQAMDYGRAYELGTSQGMMGCLPCHNKEGEGLYIPVVKSVQPDDIGPGGYFPDIDETETATGYAHNLDMENEVPPGYPGGGGGIGCLQCHDPHGAAEKDDTNTPGDPTPNSFCNLRKDPLKNDLRTPYDGGLDYNNVIIGVEDRYRFSTYISGVSKWCAACHTDFHSDSSTPENYAGGYDWLRHPTNVILSGDTGNQGTPPYLDPQWDQMGTKEIDPITKQPVVKPVDPNNDSGYDYTGNITDDKIECLTCHYAHGGPYKNTLRWDYANSNVDGCQICHNK